MSNTEAKFLLNAYRANGADAADPSFRDALAQAKSDPALQAWFAREQAHAAAMAGKLRELAPPPGLRDAILAGGRVTQQQQQPAPATRGRGWQWLGLAAVVTLLAATGVTLAQRTRATDAALLTFALQDAVDHSRHGGHGVAAHQLQVALSAPATHLSGDLPVDFHALAATGCRTVQVFGRDVLEVCFERNGSLFHCYIARAGDFRSHDAPNALRLVQDHGFTAGTWTHGTMRCVVVTNAGPDAVKALL